MPTVLLHEMSAEPFIVLGAGYGLWAHARPSRLYGAFLPEREGGERRRLATCDADGIICWLRSEGASVESIDGARASAAVRGGNAHAVRISRSPQSAVHVLLGAGATPRFGSLR